MRKDKEDAFCLRSRCTVLIKVQLITSVLFNIIRKRKKLEIKTIKYKECTESIIYRSLLCDTNK